MSGDLSESGDLSANGEALHTKDPKKKADDDDDFEFEHYAQQQQQKKPTLSPAPNTATPSQPAASSSSSAASAKPPTAKPVKDQHFDEALEVSDNEDESVASPKHSPKAANSSAPPKGEDKGKKPEAKDKSAGGAAGKDESESEGESEEDDEGGGVSDAAQAGQQAKLYNPADYKNLVVSAEIQDLFDYIGRYKPQDIELETKLKPFIPDYIPAVGEIDNFLKIPPPDGTNDGLGLTVLDEPAAHQSDPTVLELQLRVVSKQSHGKPITVRSIEQADKNPKKIQRWIQNIDEVHRQKPPPNVNPTKIFPPIDDLMQAWPSEFETLLKNEKIPQQLAEIDLSLEQMTQMVCAIMDIPTYPGKLVESLYVLFTLYSEFKNNPHFQH